MAVERFSVSRDDSIYEAWPDVALTQSGRLVCVYHELEFHTIREKMGIALRHSCNRGRRWSEKIYLPTGEMPQSRNGYFNNAQIAVLRDGRLMVLCDYVRNFEQMGESCPENTVYLWTSSDEGETWTAPKATEIHGICPDKPLELADGRLLTCTSMFDIDTGRYAAYVWYSDDGGGSWRGPVPAAAHPDYDLIEASVVQLRNGELVCFMRENSGLGYDCMKAISRDRGERWEGVYRTPLPGCHRPMAGRLQSGHLLITYRFMQGGKGWFGNWTQNFFAAVTDEDSALAKERGGQWSRIMPLAYDHSPMSDLGYSGWVQFPDGEIYAVTYIVDDAPKAQIIGLSFYESDFGECSGESYE